MDARVDSERIELNGQAPSVADLRALAVLNYGHFTSMQVRDGGVRGLGLHLQRLLDATRELFGSALDTGHVRACMRHALAGDADASLRVTVYSRSFDRAHPERALPVDVLVSVSPPRAAPTSPLRVRAVVHERVLPHVKHIGTFGLFHHLRAARLAGFDDALFTTGAGEISEGSTWDIGFREHERVVWPTAPALHGITRRLVDAGLRARGIDVESRAVFVRDLERFRSAFALNSVGAALPIAAIGDLPLEVDAAFTALLADAHASHPLEPVRAG